MVSRIHQIGVAMFAPPVEKSQTKATVASARKQAHETSTSGTGPRGSHKQEAVAENVAPRELQRGVAWDLSKVPIFPPNRKMTPFSEMARKLGLDEDTIRVRSDVGAVDFLKMNQAVAAAIDPSTILVRPECRGEDVVMSHELIHIAQLRRGVADSVQHAENAAEVGAGALRGGEVPGNIGSAGPPPLFMRLTGGAFDQALDKVGAGDAVIKLLKKSSSFMDIVRALDQHYVWLGNPKLLKTDQHAVVAGALTSGVFQGRRILEIQGGAEGGSYAPFSSPDAGIGSDLIKVSTGKGNAELVRSIAHEATHAFHAVTGKPPPTGVEASIQAGITEEIGTRKMEVTIEQEIYQSRSKESRAVENQVAAGYLSRPLVERDIAPDIGLTYLEASGFTALLADAQREDGLTDDQATDVRAIIDNDTGPKTFPMLKGQHGFAERSKYAFVCLNRKWAIAEWQKFRQDFRGIEASPGALLEKDRLLQEHANTLLDGRIKYSPLPRP